MIDKCPDNDTLTTAVLQNNIALLNTLLSSLPSVDFILNTDDLSPAPDREDMIPVSRPTYSPLMLAAKFGLLSLAEVLLEHTHNIDLTNNQGDTALIIAVISHNRPMIELLLRHRADINKRNHLHKGVLDYCLDDFSDMHGELFCYLLEQGADPHYRNSSGSSLIDRLSTDHFFTSFRQISELLCRGVTSARHHTLPIFHYSATNNVQQTLHWLENNSLSQAVLNNGLTPLMIACGNGYTDTAALFIKQGAPLDVTDQNGWSALHYAVYYNKLPCVLLLLENGSPEIYTQMNDLLLPSAVQAYAPDIVRELLSRGYHQQMAAALCQAVITGQTEVLSLLLCHTGAVNECDRHNERPLELAVSNRSLTAAKLLLTAGASPNLPTYEGNRLLKLAMQQQDSAMVQLLKQFGALSGTADQEVTGHFIRAAQRFGMEGSLEAMLTAAEKGADINVPVYDDPKHPYYGESLWHLLAMAYVWDEALYRDGFWKNLDHLAAFGSDTNRLNARQESPLLLAWQLDTQKTDKSIKQRIISFLLEH